jgi:hypothetical protein
VDARHLSRKGAGASNEKADDKASGGYQAQAESEAPAENGSITVAVVA